MQAMAHTTPRSFIVLPSVSKSALQVLKAYLEMFIYKFHILTDQFETSQDMIGFQNLANGSTSLKQQKMIRWNCEKNSQLS